MSRTTQSAFALAEAAAHATGALRRLHNRLLPQKATVLMYHGLTETPLPVADPCFVTLAAFTRQMEYLAHHFDVVHVDEVLAALDRPGRKPRACVTFDDGFESVVRLAMPVLERLGIPATVYLVTDLVDTWETVWFARLLQGLAETSEPHIAFGDLKLALDTPAARARASDLLQNALKALPRHEFAPALDLVLARLGFTDGAALRPRDPFRILRADQVRRADRKGVLRFGAHTLSHQILTRTTPADAEREIIESVGAVARLVDRPSLSFAYPNGGTGDFDGRTIDVLRRAGISCALSTESGPLDRNSDPYAMPRYNITDMPIPHFARKVHHTGDAVRTIRSAFAF